MVFALFVFACAIAHVGAQRVCGDQGNQTSCEAVTSNTCQLNGKCVWDSDMCKCQVILRSFVAVDERGAAGSSFVVVHSKFSLVARRFCVVLVSLTHVFVSLSGCAVARQRLRSHSAQTAFVATRTARSKVWIARCQNVSCSTETFVRTQARRRNAMAVLNIAIRPSCALAAAEFAPLVEILATACNVEPRPAFAIVPKFASAAHALWTRSSTPAPHAGPTRLEASSAACKPSALAHRQGVRRCASDLHHTNAALRQTTARPTRIARAVHSPVQTKRMRPTELSVERQRANVGATVVRAIFLSLTLCLLVCLQAMLLKRVQAAFVLQTCSNPTPVDSLPTLCSLLTQSAVVAVQCRAASGPCDVADNCSGSSAGCTDNKQPNTYVCSICASLS